MSLSIEQINKLEAEFEQLKQANVRQTKIANELGKQMLIYHNALQ